ncbi:unnamed protein product [Closterium sp. Naga37s-1]|nr:unnamed protein product [Closterium sp. Naga37s-1]
MSSVRSFRRVPKAFRVRSLQRLMSFHAPGPSPAVGPSAADASADAAGAAALEGTCVTAREEQEGHVEIDGACAPSGRVEGVSVRLGEAELLGVTGKTGSGKSLLLLGILGEVPHSSGAMHRSVPSLAYASQQPFLIEGTVRDNILFGTTLHKALYAKVLDACALRTDLALMPRGDESLVEEGGGNLSGGQRARMSLARAAYVALHCKMTFESTLKVLVLNSGRAAACGAWSDLCALPSAQQNCDNPPLPFAQLLKPLKAFEAPQSTWSDICTLPSAQQHCDHPPPALGQPLSGGRGVSDTGSDSAMCATVTVSGTVVCAPVTTDTGVDGTIADSRSCKSGTTVVCSSKRDTGSDSAMCATVTGGDCAAAGNATVTTNTGVDGTVVHSQRCKTGDTAGSSSGSCVDRGTGSERDTDAPTVGTRGCRVGIHGDSSVRGSEERAEVEQAEAAALIGTGDEVEKIQLTKDGIHRNTSLRGSEKEVLLGTEAEVETAEVGKGVVDACREGERVSLEDQAAEGSLCKSREGPLAAESYSLFRRGEGEQEESGSTEGDEQGLLDVEGWQRGAIPLLVFWGYARKIRVLPLLLFAALFLAAHVSNALVSW